MYGNGVLVVLNHYNRPQNMPQLISAWKSQSVRPSSLVVVDNTIGECQPAYPNPIFAGADDVWRWKINAGCAAHFAPALTLHGHKYVLFADDDVLPGRRAVEYLLETASFLQDRFATIGQEGRNFLLDQPAGKRYSGRSCPVRSTVPIKTHITCQAHLVRADSMVGVLHFRQALLDAYREEADRLCKTHDDFLLCLGAQSVSHYPCYVNPVESEPSQCLIASRVGASDTTAVYRRPTHFAERARMVDMSLEIGWRPL